MKVLTLASLKGGTGKTTLAAHLAVEAETDGHRVAILDLDAQANLADWYNDREAEAPAYARAGIDTIAGAVQTLAQADYTLAIIDMPSPMPC